MRNNSKKFKRIKLDGAYMFAAVFAGIGGLIILGSYASSKPIETYNLGNYNLSDYSTDQANVFLLGLNSKYNYCLTPVISSNRIEVSIQNSQGGVEYLPVTVVDSSTMCFKPNQNSERSKVKITPVPQKPVTLKVS